MFGKLKMRWWAVILFAIAAGIYTGVVMSVDALANTSLQDIGVTYEWWVIFAVIIVVNCEKAPRAMLKCFVFFLISQPLVFATEVVLGTLTADKALYYYRSIWLPITFLTLPGGLIAFYCKKQNVLGAVILGLGNTIECIIGLSYLLKVIQSFPRHLFTVVVCFGSILLMSFKIQRVKKYRAISIILPIVLTAAAALVLHAAGRTL